MWFRFPLFYVLCSNPSAKAKRWDSKKNQVTALCPRQLALGGNSVHTLCTTATFCTVNAPSAQGNTSYMQRTENETVRCFTDRNLVRQKALSTVHSHVPGLTGFTERPGRSFDTPANAWSALSIPVAILSHSSGMLQFHSKQWAVSLV